MDFSQHLIQKTYEHKIILQCIIDEIIFSLDIVQCQARLARLVGTISALSVLARVYWAVLGLVFMWPDCTVSRWGGAKLATTKNLKHVEKSYFRRK